MKLLQFLIRLEQEVCLKKLSDIIAFAIFFISYFTSVADAAHLGVYPLGLALNAKQNSGIITVTNSGSESISIQAETLSWLQENNEQHYLPSNNILVKPQVFTILPEKSQELIIKNTQNSDIKQEKAYRLLLTEIPSIYSPSYDPIESEPKGLTTLLQLNLPLYIKPLTSIGIQQWRAYYNEKGNIVLALNNKGNVHIRVHHILIHDDMGMTSSMLEQKNIVIFPQKTKIWEFKPKSIGLIRTIQLEIKTDLGIQTQSLDVENI